MSKHYRFFTAHDFALDDYFIQWVQSPTTESNTFWQDWIEKHPEKKEVIEEARQLVRALDFNSLRPSPKEFRDVKTRIDAEIGSGTETSKNSAGMWKKWMSVAAMIILMMATFLLYKEWSTPHMVTYTTGFGETRSVVLPDHSVVTLNANSSLEHSSNWDNTPIREVWLRGEGFFDVKKAKHRVRDDSMAFKRFLVHSGAVNIEVLGTSFNVSNRREIPEVVLATGTISLQIPNERDTAKMIMQPGDLIRYTSSNSELVRKKVDPARFTSWKDHRLYFEETTLTEVAEIIEENYGLKVIFESRKMRNIRLTGTVSTESLDTFLAVISESIDKTIETKDGHIIIKN